MARRRGGRRRSRKGMLVRARPRALGPGPSPRIPDSRRAAWEPASPPAPAPPVEPETERPPQPEEATAPSPSVAPASPAPPFPARALFHLLQAERARKNGAEDLSLYHKRLAGQQESKSDDEEKPEDS